MSFTVSASSPDITYSPRNAWTPTQSGTMTTTHAGAIAELTFDGLTVQVYGMLLSLSNSVKPKPVSSYALDGATPVQFNATNLSVAAQQLDIPQTFVFFQSNSALTGQNHSLVITSLEDEADFTLGSIVFTQASDSTSASSAPLSFISSTSSLSTEPISTSSYMSAPSSSASAATINGAQRISAGMIGGITVAAAFVIFAVILALCWLHRRRRTRILSMSEAKSPDRDQIPVPFMAERHSIEPQKSNAPDAVTWLFPPSVHRQSDAPSISTIGLGPPPSYTSNES
ncbi:hypothetical protein J3R30DRAFT_2881718 [Lentinula aciculospora]|uniref:Mid2 domain-containing protein n=1 Tax=Lentinula aciculospora TaxID=153920 RepID=A0A9W9AAL0_9AGAR|nr:hypothetical protein J3R30DRAFT_2881718 [Lentinula aciculospora]